MAATKEKTYYGLECVNIEVGSDTIVMAERPMNENFDIRDPQHVIDHAAQQACRIRADSSTTLSSVHINLRMYGSFVLYLWISAYKLTSSLFRLESQQWKSDLTNTLFVCPGDLSSELVGRTRLVGLAGLGINLSVVPSARSASVHKSIGSLHKFSICARS